MGSDVARIAKRWRFERRTTVSGESIDVIGHEATVAQAVIDIAALLRREQSLKAMVEQMEPPHHDVVRCGSNDCPACEWLAVADDIDWPTWRNDVRLEGADVRGDR